MPARAHRAGRHMKRAHAKRGRVKRIHAKKLGKLLTRARRHLKKIA